MLYAFNQSNMHEWHAICFGKGKVLKVRKRYVRARRMTPDAMGTAIRFTPLSKHILVVKFGHNEAMSLSS